MVRGVLRWLPWPVGALFSATGSTPGSVPVGRYQMIALLPRIDAPLTVALAVAVLVAAGLSVGVTFLGGAVVGAVPGAVRDGLDSPAGRRGLLAVAATGAAAVAAGVVGQVRAVLATPLGQRLELHLEERVMRAVGRPAGIAHLEDPAVLDRIAQAQEVGTAGDRPGRALLALANLAPKWLRSAAFVVVLAQFSAWLALGVFAAWYGAGYLERRATVRASQAVIEQARLLRRSNYVRDLALTPGAAKEVRVFGLTGWLVRRFRAAWMEAMADVWRARRLTTGPLLGAVALLAAALVFVAVALGGAALRGEIGPGALAVYLAAALGVGGFFGLVPDDRALLYGAAAVPAVFDLERRTSAASPRGYGPAPPATGLPRHRIRFEGVRFRYPGAAADVLTDFDLEITAGRSLALVGANGAGKTTLVKLLCRLYEPAAGRITVDGVDLRDLDAGAWQRQVAAVFQDFVRYHLPLRDNVAFGAPGAAADAARLNEAARRAGALDLVAALPRGWDTVLSREYAGGADLSGGQWQRVALARALFAAGPSPGSGAGRSPAAIPRPVGATVLVLDEPTAHLDVRAEAALYDRFLELTRGLTTLLISHRFSTVRRADRICVLDGGRVAELGAHDQLVAAGGRYARLFALQAAGFASPAAGTEAPGQERPQPPRAQRG